MSVAVLSSTGRKLMPTSNYKARKLLKSGRAEIYAYRPIFTIRLKDRKEGETQPIEYACDTGYQHVGVSIKSEKHEFVHAQYDMLSNETERHNDCRKYRRTRRNHKRYRKPRFDSRSKKNKEMAPSLRHRKENQIRLFESFCKVMPITSATFEMGKFDTQLLQAIANGKPLPEGKDYQQGSKYLYQTEREAVFGRDHYTCQVCGKSVKDGVILNTHHIGYWKGYRSNRISNLLTVCEHCHTAKNHKPGGIVQEPVVTRTGYSFLSWSDTGSTVADTSNSNPNTYTHRASWEHWVFSGWSIKPDGSGTIYAPGEALPNRNLDLYAQWRREVVR